MCCCHVTAALDPAAAALIGAGAAAVVGLVAQYFAHRLSIRRDRRNHRREKLHEAVVIAGSALMRVGETPPEPKQKPPYTASELYGEPGMDETMPFAIATANGIGLLSIHFGRDHWIIDEYIEAATLSLDAFAAFHHDHRDGEDTEGEGETDVNRLMDQLGAAKRACDTWIERARAEVEAI